jgi:hypothetical protein
MVNLKCDIFAHIYPSHTPGWVSTCSTVDGGPLRIFVLIKFTFHIINKVLHAHTIACWRLILQFNTNKGNLIAYMPNLQVVNHITFTIMLLNKRSYTSFREQVPFCMSFAFIEKLYQIFLRYLKNICRNLYYLIYTLMADVLQRLIYIIALYNNTIYTYCYIR